MTDEAASLEKKLKDLLAAARGREPIAPSKDAEPWSLWQKVGDHTGNLLNAILEAALKRGVSTILFEPLKEPGAGGRNLLLKSYDEGDARCVLALIESETYQKVFARILSLAHLKVGQTDQTGAILAKSKQSSYKIDVYTFHSETHGQEDCVLEIKPC